jgi:hypothetical protein
MNWDVIVTIGVAAIGATWTLHTKLSDIERKLDSHVSRINDLDNRVVSLEDWRKAKGGRDR